MAFLQNSLVFDQAQRDNAIELQPPLGRGFRFAKLKRDARGNSNQQFHAKTKPSHAEQIYSLLREIEQY